MKGIEQMHKHKELKKYRANQFTWEEEKFFLLNGEVADGHVGIGYASDLNWTIGDVPKVILVQGKNEELVFDFFHTNTEAISDDLLGWTYKARKEERRIILRIAND